MTLTMNQVASELTSRGYCFSGNATILQKPNEPPVVLLPGSNGPEQCLIFLAATVDNDGVTPVPVQDLDDLDFTLSYTDLSDEEEN